MKKKIRHLLSPKDLSFKESISIISEGKRFKKQRLLPFSKKTNLFLQGKMIGLLFEKSSTRTRISFEVGVRELGGESFFLSKQDIQIGRGESFLDTAKVLERYFHGLIIRNNDHESMVKVAEQSSIPFINGLSNQHHPCQVLADAMIIDEVINSSKPKIAYIGDGNNMALSLIEICSLLKWPLIVTTPKLYPCPPKFLKKCLIDPQWITFNHDYRKATKGCEVIYTDTWYSMGQEKKLQKTQAFKNFQVNSNFLKDASPDYIFLHCLPAYRGKEVSAEIIDGPHSKVFDQAENRLHVQKAILNFFYKD